MILQNIGINFGCGLNVAEGWRNYDASSTLWVQRLPILGLISRQLIKPHFPDLAIYGDVINGLPESDGFADYVYCSHVLEHFSLDNFRKVLLEVQRVLKESLNKSKISLKPWPNSLIPIGLDFPELNYLNPWS